MSAELALVQSPNDIEGLSAEQQAQVVTQWLVQSKSYLERAAQEVDLTRITEFKAWAASLAEFTRQRGLGEEIQIDAQEMVRRAERGIGKAIRNGQESGEVRSHGSREHEFRGNRHQEASNFPQRNLASPSDFFSGGGHQRETYAMTDGVPDEMFEEALEEARKEKNLSRRNVIRKIQARLPEPAAEPAVSEPVDRRRVHLAARRDEIEEWARNGASTRQIAEKLGVRIDNMTKFVRANGIDVPADRIVGKTHRIDPERVVQETVNTLQGVGYSLGLLSKADYDNFSTDQIGVWLEEMKEPYRAVRKLMKELNNRA